MNKRIHQAIVLCAGLGKRLGELIAGQPKAMLPIAGRPLIEHIFKKLLDEAGLSRVVLVVGPHGEPIRHLFRTESRIKFAMQSFPKRTADALMAADELLEERFLLTYGDLWVKSLDYRRLRHDAEKDDRQRIAINRTLPVAWSISLSPSRKCAFSLLTSSATSGAIRESEGA